MRAIGRAWSWALAATVFFVAAEAFARPRQQDPLDGCAACGGCSFVFIVIPIILLVLNIALLVWVARDAKSRGMDSSVLWMFLVMFTGLIGLVIYIFARPQGDLAVCPFCGGNRLQASVRCPHCGNGGAPPPTGYGPPQGPGYGPQGGGYPPPPGGYGPPPGGGYGPPPGGYGG